MDINIDIYREIYVQRIPLNAQIHVRSLPCCRSSQCFRTWFGEHWPSTKKNPGLIKGLRCLYEVFQGHFLQMFFFCRNR